MSKVTNSKVMDRIDVIEKKLPNGEVKHINDDMGEYKKQALAHEKKMDLMAKDIRQIRKKLSEY